MIRVVAGIIVNDLGEILIAKKKQEKVLGGHWEFPGGKIECGETLSEALVRELREEMNIEVVIQSVVGTNIHHYEKVSIEITALKVLIQSKDIILIDHDEIKWVRDVEMLEYNLAPADIPLAKKYLEMTYEK